MMVLFLQLQMRDALKYSVIRATIGIEYRDDADEAAALPSWRMLPLVCKERMMDFAVSLLGEDAPAICSPLGTIAAVLDALALAALLVAREGRVEGWRQHHRDGARAVPPRPRAVLGRRERDEHGGPLAAAGRGERRVSRGGRCRGIPPPVAVVVP